MKGLKIYVLVDAKTGKVYPNIFRTKQTEMEIFRKQVSKHVMGMIFKVRKAEIVLK